MKTLALLLALIAIPAAAQRPSSHEIAAWQAQAQRITITRDDWGIAHVRGRTDADAVFGMIYAQAEDDFNRVETNFINAMGRLAEAEGEAAIWQDLRMKLFIDPNTLRTLYAGAEPSMRALMDAWADGLNFYLHTHPETKPRVIARFEPWMALSFSEGSIGGDIARVNLKSLAALYGKDASTPAPQPEPEDERFREPSGSNGIAIAPSNTVNRRALLWINPHTSFFFRSELQMTSDEGLNAYGAVTWGQFFIYQGFNATAGWMHTTSSADQMDEYLETVSRRGSGFVYRYGSGARPVTSEQIVVSYKTTSGMAQKAFTVYRTHHGPVVREVDGKWVTVKLMNEPLKALTQSYTRTKAKNYAEFAQTMQLHTNSSNNTLFADAEGNIAYLHANFIPRRDAAFDWRAPMDGSNPATEWQGLHTMAESPNVVNPREGWVYNTNNAPWSAAGRDSPKQANFPRYMDNGAENPRGIHAIRLLTGKKDFTVESLTAAGFDSYMPAFAVDIPPLVSAYDGLAATDPLKQKLAEQIALLRKWDFRWSADSVATSLGVFWWQQRSDRNAGHEAQLAALAAASDKLAADFGTWKAPWGEINRFQRLTGAIIQKFDDSKPSTPVPFTSGIYGSLASFGARAYPGTKRWYGTSGNSFVAIVEFGPRVRARAVSAGGESGNPASRHFTDQAERFASGNLREVYFYPEQLRGHVEREYRPGE